MRGKFDFGTPLVVHFDDQSHPISNIQQAASFLDRYWKGPENLRWELAIHFCEAALFGVLKPEEVRYVLLQAIREAGMSVDYPITLGPEIGPTLK